MSIHENCDSCGTDYDLTPANARLVLFLDYLTACHIEARCTNCGGKEIIYVTTQGFIKVLAEAKLGVSFGLMPDDDRKAKADATWGSHVKDEDEPEPEYDVPHWMLRELFDTLRQYEAEN